MFDKQTDFFQWNKNKNQDKKNPRYQKKKSV